MLLGYQNVLIAEKNLPSGLESSNFDITHGVHCSAEILFTVIGVSTLSRASQYFKSLLVILVCLTSDYAMNQDKAA
jgi:hypothetical protein